MLLSEFVKLAQGTPADVMRFAQRWGALSLCRMHGLPFGHSRSCIESRPFLTQEGSESIGHWIRTAKGFEALIGLAIAFKKRSYGDDADWDSVEAAISGPDFPSATPHKSIIKWVDDERERLAVARLRFQIEVDRLIKIARITPRLWWNQKRDRFQVDFDSSTSQTPNLLCVLTLQLLPVLVNPDGRKGFAKCSDCGRPYRVDRRPNPNRRNYCTRCKKSAWRDSKRDQRRKRATAEGL